MNVVWTCHTFENNLKMKHNFAKYLKESCRKRSDELVSFKYFLNIAFVREIPPKLSGGFGYYGHEWVKNNLRSKHELANYLSVDC